MKLENDGGSGTAGSHWERSVIYNEYMVGIVPRYDGIFSEFTYNLFLDTGWYHDLNKDFVESITWGKG